MFSIAGVYAKYNRLQLLYFYNIMNGIKMRFRNSYYEKLGIAPKIVPKMPLINLAITKRQDKDFNKIFDNLHIKYDLKDTNRDGLSINRRKLLDSLPGLCAGLSMFWLFCMVKERNPDLFFGIKHFYTKITQKNKDNFLSFEEINRTYFKNISRYLNDLSEEINRTYFKNISRYLNIKNTGGFDEQKKVRLKNSLIEYHKIADTIFKTNVCGVCSLSVKNNGFDFKEFFNAITKVIDSNKNREVFITISSIDHAMALFARRSNLKGLLDDYYEFIFFDPNDHMGESIPMVLTPNKFRSELEIQNKFRMLLGKERRTNYFTKYQDFFFYNIFELSDLKP